MPGENRFMDVTEDPIFSTFPSPDLPLKLMTRLMVHIVAGDVADRLRSQVGNRLLERAVRHVERIGVVEDAFRAFSVGGVNAMYDVTECSVLHSLWEMSTAVGIPLRVDPINFPVLKDIAAVAAALDFDPRNAMRDGIVLTAVTPESVDRVWKPWAQCNIPGRRLDRFDAFLARSVVRREDRGQAPDESDIDSFRNLFFAAGKGGQKA